MCTSSVTIAFKGITPSLLLGVGHFEGEGIRIPGALDGKCHFSFL